MFKIRDTGQGIQPKDQEKIFYKFEQSSSGENDHPTGANGLGLAFCKLAVEAHGGKIWVESDGQGKGSTFQFYLPVQNE